MFFFIFSISVNSRQVSESVNFYLNSLRLQYPLRDAITQLHSRPHEWFRHAGVQPAHTTNLDNPLFLPLHAYLDSLYDSWLLRHGPKEACTLQEPAGASQEHTAQGTRDVVCVCVCVARCCLCVLLRERISLCVLASVRVWVSLDKNEPRGHEQMVRSR